MNLMKNTLGRFDRWLESLNPYKPEDVLAQGGVPVEVEDTPGRKRLARIVTFAFIAFMLWAFFAPIDAGVSVQGSIVVYGSRKAVQHPAGGVVSKINVKEGSHVKQGDTLVSINPLTTEANLNSTELDYINALAAESRLNAERADMPIDWLGELDAMPADDRRVAEAKQMQLSLYGTRRKDQVSQKQMQQEQKEGSERQMVELKHIMALRRKQLEVMTEEVRNNRELAAEGYIPRSKANELERNRDEMLTSLATTSAEITKLASSIAANRLQIHQIDVTFRKDVDSQLADIQKTRMSLKNKVDALKFDLSLTELKAPVGGVVVGLKVTTEGGVIQAGQVLMEIVPVESSLIVEAQVPPAMIDKVHVGLEADMRFTAFNQTTTPVIPGRIKLVGADRIEPPNGGGNGEGYYLAQIETTTEGKALLGGKAIQPGMPVEVIIKTGERSFMSYLLKPISDRLARAFKEN